MGYRNCLATQCITGCCDYYAYCVYPYQTAICYTNITYYYYDYWWVYTVCSILILCIILSAIGGARRRRNRLRRQRDQIIITGNVNPSFVQGRPVYPNQGELITGSPAYYENMGQMQGGMNNVAYGLAQQTASYGGQPVQGQPVYGQPVQGRVIQQQNSVNSNTSGKEHSLL